MNSNWTFKTIAIKGKDYVTINERVKCFRNCPEFDGWSIKTEILHFDKDSVVFKSTITDKDGKVLATGHAQEDRTSTMINKTSYVENCETSAVGRALGLLGIGIENSIATYDEVKRAISAQEEIESKPKPSKVNINAAITKVNSCNSVEDLTLLWNNNKELQTIDEFKNAIIIRRNELK